MWLVLWLLFYHPPDRHPLLTRGAARGDCSRNSRSRASKPTPVGWGALLGYRQVWAIVLARFMVDPIWWLYITWLPKYLSDARGFSLVADRHSTRGCRTWRPTSAA